MNKKRTLLLKILYQQSLDTNKGYTFILALALGLALHSLLIAYAVVLQVERTSTKSAADINSGFYGAEAGLNRRAEELRETFVDFNNPSGISPSSVANCLDSNSSNDGTGDYKCRQQEFVAGTENREGHIAATYVVERNGGLPRSGVVPRGEAYQNLNMLEYVYSIYSIAKPKNAPTSEVTAILQLDIKSRLIPMFQFAAFYANDLEILPGPVMDLSGPVHTNGDLYLGAGKKFGLNIDGQITLSGELYNKRKNNNSTYPNERVTIMNAAGTDFLNLLSEGTGSETATTNAMDPVLVGTAWGTQIQIGLEAISLPPPSFLDKTGEYYQKADIRFLYKPVATSTSAPNLIPVPFEVTRLDRSSGTTVSLTEGERRSLRQPILVSQELASIADAKFKVCTPGSSGSAIPGVAADKLADFLYVAMVSQPKPIAYTSLSLPLNHSDLAGVKTSLINLIDSLGLDPTTSTAIITAIINETPREIAALDNRCFVSAAVQDIGRDDPSHQSRHRFRNDREVRDMRLLQLNFKSLAIWNQVGRYARFNAGALISDNNGLGFSANEKLFKVASPDSSAPQGSFQNLGLGARDTTEGGLVMYATIDDLSYPDADTETSPYGFAITQGQQLMSIGESSNRSPLGVTFATDQAIYLQGDYNKNNKQPAAILADSINVLSNSCLNSDKAINKNENENCDIDGSKQPGTSTTINSALLGGTDETDSDRTSGYNGGLENYPRFSENWSDNTLTYRGSFVSLGTPEHVKGTWGSQDYSPPERDWDYDLDFNDADNLPPLTPRFVYLRQESFIRNFQQ
ncbi:hypothetical protein [Crocosphaera sp. Alani8]|uniref:hypothetical protein n=1 Tax=Crocosphaera sp. Alani8 TaxID=3038952 RepID=UPI00313CC5F4